MIGKMWLSGEEIATSHPKDTTDFHTGFLICQTRLRWLLNQLMQEYTKDCPGSNCKWDDALSVWAYSKGFEAGLHHKVQRTPLSLAVRDARIEVLQSELATVTVDRDKARRELCEQELEDARDADDICRSRAKHRGWLYLYEIERGTAAEKGKEG